MYYSVLSLGQTDNVISTHQAPSNSGCGSLFPGIIAYLQIGCKEYHLDNGLSTISSLHTQQSWRNGKSEGST